MAYQNLFNTLENLYGVTALQSEMFEIIDAIEKDETEQKEISFNPMLAAGASKWTHRTYNTNMTASEMLQIEKQIKEQDETKDNIIILQVMYNVATGSATIEDKICTCR
jgi:hypothetical protein